MTSFADNRITESSGLAASHTYPGILWTLNDEAKKPHVYGVNSTTGKTVATFSLQNALIFDPEAISLDSHDRIWVGDTGDNDETRPYVRVFFRGEPVPNKSHGDLACTGYRLTYPGGTARNAESFFVHPTTGVAYIVTKEASSGLYSLPAKLRVPPRSNALTLVDSSMGAFVSDAAITPDGRFLLTRRKDENTTVYVHRTTDWAQVDTITVPSQTKPEGITVSADQKSFWISSEGKHAPFYKVTMPTAYQPLKAVATPKPPKADTPCG